MPMTGEIVLADQTVLKDIHGVMLQDAGIHARGWIR